ncbi:uncharacterized protein M437DRAFT_45883 [Aureobasidium melanogenum CBS 110374]|uniref:Uncharacterized protein n=1 Tax=Aureobasidium melanogenum (strain CBS 110374) TaxID=1043003 RepID=A0A074WMW6_AURM1|nr:uncharacterized protein M437DRAFT_45883 [Aureobasidium melanogenum CBS 110374]KEQ63816.1 hypothetical protein M437DRAFT_45883 [Aureobasidium melanogenum CBS 110374]
MQTFRYITHQVPLRLRVCLGLPLSSAATSRTFFTSPVQNKSSEHHELPKDSALSTESELTDDSETPNDPELQKERLRQYKNAWSRNKYHTNPIWRERDNARSSIYKRNRRAVDQEYCDRHVEYARKHYKTKRDTDPDFAIRLTLGEWVYQSAVTREQLSWKTHVPILTSEKLERYCASCGGKRRGGMRLYWRRRQESQAGEDVYDCNRCFFNNPAIRLPEGFDHVKTVDQLRLRREQLLGIKTRPYKWRTTSPTPGT